MALQGGAERLAMLWTRGPLSFSHREFRAGGMVLLILFLFIFTSSIQQEMRVAPVAAEQHYSAQTLAAYPMLPLSALRPVYGLFSPSPLLGNSVVGTHCKVASTSLCGTLCLSKIDCCTLLRSKWVVPNRTLCSSPSTSLWGRHWLNRLNPYEIRIEESRSGITRGC